MESLIEGYTENVGETERAEHKKNTVHTSNVLKEHFYTSPSNQADTSTVVL